MSLAGKQMQTGDAGADESRADDGLTSSSREKCGARGKCGPSFCSSWQLQQQWQWLCLQCCGTSAIKCEHGHTGGSLAAPGLGLAKQYLGVGGDSVQHWREAMATSDRVRRRRRGMSTLQELCLDKLSVHASALHDLGDLPDAIVSEILRRSSLAPTQLVLLEKANAARDISHLTAPLWRDACIGELKISPSELKPPYSTLYRRTKEAERLMLKASMAAIAQKANYSTHPRGYKLTL